MNAAVVAIMDRDDWSANTDILVVADPRKRRLTWIPRDLWSPLLKDRINTAFARGGGNVLLAALRELGFGCEAVICLRRAATEALLTSARISVSVSESMEFWYPLEPTRPIEEGRKRVSFMPPSEELVGERLHQWIGARIAIRGPGSDFSRIKRQQILLRAMLETDFDFQPALRDPDLVKTVGDPMPALARIDRDWKVRTFDAVLDRAIGGKAVLATLPLGERLLRAALRRPRHR